MKVTSPILTTVMTGLNTYTIMTANTPNNAYMNAPFLAGIWQLTTGFTAVGVDTMSRLGQGFHAAHINDNTVMGGMDTGVDLITIPNMNVIFRVSGNVATPVELMNFQVK